MFVFFEFFAPFFEKLWINYLNHLSHAPARLPCISSSMRRLSNAAKRAG